MILFKKSKKPSYYVAMGVLLGVAVTVGGTLLYFDHLREKRAAKLKASPIRAIVAHLLRLLVKRIERSILA